MSCISAKICSSQVVRDIEENCENPMFGGYASNAVWINKADIKSVGYDATNGRIIRNITLKDGARAYKVVNAAAKPFNGTNTSLVVGDYKNQFTRTVSFYIPFDGADAAEKVVEPIANGKGVLILEAEWNAKSDVNRFEVFGIDRGLKATSMVKNTYENNGYWIVEVAEEEVSTSGKWLQHLQPATVGGTYDIAFEADSVSSTIGYASLTFTPTSGTAEEVPMENITIDGLKFKASVGDLLVSGSITYSGEDTLALAVEGGKISITCSSSFSTSDFSGSVTAMEDGTCDYLSELVAGAE